MINRIFLLAHQDDEMGVFSQIKECVKNHDNIHIFFLTNGNIEKKIIIRLLKKEKKKALEL